MSTRLAGQVDLETWLDNNLMTAARPYADIALRDYHFRIWIIWMDEFDTYRATSYPVGEEDAKDVTGVTLDKITYSVTVLG